MGNGGRDSLRQNGIKCNGGRIREREKIDSGTKKSFIYFSFDFLALHYKATIEKVSAKMHWTEKSLEKTSNLRVF